MKLLPSHFIVADQSIQQLDEMIRIFGDTQPTVRKLLEQVRDGFEHFRRAVVDAVNEDLAK